MGNSSHASESAGYTKESGAKMKPIPIDREVEYYPFFEAELEREVREFKEYKADCESMASWAARNSNCCPPSADAADQLNRGKKRIEKLRKQLAEIDQELGKSPEGVAKRKSEQHERVRHQKLNEQLRGITSVNI